MAKAYIAPFCLYLGGTALISQWPEHYPLSYLAVVIVVGTATAWLLVGKAILKPHLNVLPGLVVGVIGVAVWIGLFELAWEEQLGSHLPEWLRPQPRLGFNPYAHFSDPLWVWGFVSVRLLGLVVLVPIVEEIFWRGFLRAVVGRSGLGKGSLGAFFRAVVFGGGGAFYVSPSGMAGGGGLLRAAQWAAHLEAGSLELCHRPCREQLPVGGLHPRH